MHVVLDGFHRFIFSLPNVVNYLNGESGSSTKIETMHEIQSNPKIVPVTPQTQPDASNRSSNSHIVIENETGNVVVIF